MPLDKYSKAILKAFEESREARETHDWEDEWRIKKCKICGLKVFKLVFFSMVMPTCEEYKMHSALD